MDNKITKKRINDHLEYDWFKYILILIAAILVGYFVFSQINRNKDYETIDFFISCYSSDSNQFESKAMTEMADMDAKYGENAVREIALSEFDPLSKDYGTMYMTRGAQSSDILILPKGYLEDGGSGYIKLTDELLNDYLLPEGVKISDLEYFEHENSETKVKSRYGIRVDTFAKMNGIVFQMDWKKVDQYKDQDWGENEPPTEFYMVLNPNSVSIGKFGKKSKPEHAQALFCFNKFIDYYFK